MYFLNHPDGVQLNAFLIIIITPVVFSICFSRAWMEAHGSARLSRKRKREGSNGEAEEGQKALKLKRYTVVSEMKVCTDERWYLSSKAVLLLAPQGLKYPAPYADQLESMEEKLYQRVTMEEARKGTPRRLLANSHSDIHMLCVTSIHRPHDSNQVDSMGIIYGHSQK